MIYLELLTGTFILLLVLLVMMLFENKKLKGKIKILKEVLALKNTTISNFEASRVAVKDVIENFSAHEEVMVMVEAGKSRTEISEKMDIPVNKIELIIKFDKIKKEKHL